MAHRQSQGRVVLVGHKSGISSSQPTNFTLVFSDLHVYASMFSVVLMNYIFMDGKCDYFQGEHPHRAAGTWSIPWDVGWGALGPTLGSSACWGSRCVVT